MPTNYKVLGQSNPAATTLTSLYTVPSATEAVVSSISVANLTSTDATFRIAFRPSGEAIADKHHIIYDATIAGNDTYMINQGMSMGATDVLSVYASTASVCFVGFYAEVT